MGLRRYFNSFFLKGETEFYIKALIMDTINRILGGQFSFIYIKLILGVMEFTQTLLKFDIKFTGVC